MQVLVVACGAAHLPHTACALQNHNALAAFWTSNKNSTGIAPAKFKRAWRFHLAMKPIYHTTPAGLREKIFHAMFPLWHWWIRSQKPPPFDVALAMMGYGTEPFEISERTGALRVVDASSSHPTSFYGFWQRECDLWCPGTKPGIPRWLFARCTRELEQADLILCPSVFVRDSMLLNGIPEAKCKLNPYGVETSVFTPRSALPDKPRFVCVGGICLRKGHQYLFRAFEKVRKALPGAELICAGSYLPDFGRERKRWEGTFTHYENLSHKELAELLRKATAFVFPSNEEGFARAIIEAMSAGLPIVATYESGATTLVRDGTEGIIVRGRDIEQLAQAMITLATDAALNQRMGEAACLRGAKNNSWEDYGNRLVEILGEALARKSGDS